jgi:hypothetical protein
MELFVLGGHQILERTSGCREWRFDEALLVRLDTKTGLAEVVFRYRTPAALCPADEPSVLFKAGSWDGNHLLLCTQTDVVRLDPFEMRVCEHYSHPWLNDVHHVARIDGRLHVVSTGLDCVLVLDRDGQVSEVRGALDEDPLQRRDPAVDWRLVPTTKPHAAHPNFVFRTRHGLWLTRFEQRDAICLDDRARRIPLGDSPPHDGLVRDGQLWFTRVDGHVLVADPETCRVVDDYDLRASDFGPEPLGWCRGLHVEDGVAFVGYSSLRSTRWKENLRWLKPGFAGRRPTRVVALELATRQNLAEWELEPLGLQTIFAVLPAKP